MLDQFDPLQGDGAELEFWLLRKGVDGVVGDGVDCQVLAEHIAPVKRRKAIALTHPVGHHGGQHGAAAH
ncbi:hypothetical protein D3C84_196000 [compost metagenome]